MNSPEELTNLLTIMLIVMFALLVVFLIIFFILKSKQNKIQQAPEKEEKKIESDAKKIAKEYTKESIFKFMEFDRVEDNMIVQKNGNRYLMAIECQGVNYDLMSENEKISVEEGFLQFLNTLRYPIQIYIQTRTVNLNDSIENYRKKIQEIEMQLNQKRNEYTKKLNSGNYSREELEKEFYELTKQTNLYEYGKDIIQNTERMSLNKNVLNKKYYIIIPYYSEEVGNGDFDKEEIRNLAFSELYTKAQSLITALSGCEVSGRIMDSNELVDLLYVAYNRDDSEVFSIDKALRSGYDELYTTAPDVLDKKMRQLDENIERKALDLVNEKVLQARSKKQREVEEKEARFAELIRQRAEIILNQNADYIGRETAEMAQELIENEDENDEEIIDEELENEEIEETIPEVEEKPKRARKTTTKVKKEAKPKSTTKAKKTQTKDKGGKENVEQKETKSKTRRATSTK